VIQSIAGGNTGMSFVLGIAVSSSGQIYVPSYYCCNPGCPSAVLVYAAGSNGDVAPIQEISGGSTDLSCPRAIALDSQGNMYVVNNFSGAESVTVFAAGANGNVPPIREIAGANTGLNSPYGIALDSSGKIYVTNTSGGPSGQGSITVYRNGAKGNIAPIRTIAGSNVQIGYGIAVR
jgi:hypothetical protein